MSNRGFLAYHPATRIPHPVPEPVVLDRAPGGGTGLAIPAHGEAPLRDGAARLTEAFRRFGSLGPDNAVARLG